MKKFRLIKMTVQGFRTFESAAIFEFDRISTVSGDNGYGKSSVGEALAYALTGSTFFGDVKNNDRLINTKSRKIKVELEYTDADGKLHKLTRSRSGSMTTLIHDDAPIRQTDLDKRFGERNVVLSIINPLYFIERLAENGGREFLMELLPQVDDDTVKASLCEPYRVALENQNIPDPAYYLKLRREEKREAEEKVVYTKGRLDYLLEQTKILKGNPNPASIDKQIMELHNALSLLDKSKPEPTDTALLLNEKSELEKELVRLQCTKPEITDTSELERSKVEVTAKVVTITGRQYIFSKQDELSNLNGQLEAMRTEYRSASDKVGSIKAGEKCPLCIQSITPTHVAVIRNETKRQLDGMCEKANALKGRINALLAEKQTGQKQFELERDNAVSVLESELADIEKKITEAEKNNSAAGKRFAEQTLKAITRITSRVKNIDAEISSIQADDKDKKDAYDQNTAAKRLEILGELEKAQQLKSSHSSLEAMQKEISQNNDILKSFDENIKLLDSRINAAAEFASQKAELILKPLQMNRVSIKLQEVIKSTGEIANTFKFTYLGRDYKLLSLSEKVKAGLEVSEAIKKITSRDYPVFIDNSESISSIDNVGLTEGQYIFAMKVTGQQLKVAPGWNGCQDVKIHRKVA